MVKHLPVEERGGGMLEGGCTLTQADPIVVQVVPFWNLALERRTDLRIREGIPRGRFAKAIDALRCRPSKEEHHFIRFQSLSDRRERVDKLNGRRASAKR
jgi:hypothetical protein